VGLAAALFAGVAAVSLMAAVRPGSAQETDSLAHRIETSPDGSVRFSYASREGV
jgi:hypothetical protein